MLTSHTGRREFLKTAGVLSATSVLPAQVRGANDRISLGFIGIGVMGSENLRAAMARPGVAIAAVCDVYQPNLERAAALVGIRPSAQRDEGFPRSAVG